MPQAKGVFLQSARDLVVNGCGLPYHFDHRFMHMTFLVVWKLPINQINRGKKESGAQIFWLWCVTEPTVEMVQYITWFIHKGIQPVLWGPDLLGFHWLTSLSEQKCVQQCVQNHGKVPICMQFMVDLTGFWSLQMHSKFIQTFNILGQIWMYHKSIQKFNIWYWIWRP